MAIATTTVKIGELDVLVETSTVAGTEPTSRMSDVTAEVTDAFSRAQQTILAVASSTAATLGETARRGSHPSQLEIEFGLKFTATGNVLVAGASGEASLRVKLTYDTSTA